MVTDNFSNQSEGLQSPGCKKFGITPSDGSPDLSEVTRGVIVGVAGDLNCKLADDDDFSVIPALAAGVVHPLRVQAVKSTDTTATTIVGIV